MAFEKIKARLREVSRGIPTGALAAAAREVKARYLADSVSARGNTPYTPTDVQVRAKSDGVEVTAPEWSMKTARREGQPTTWREIVAAVLRKRIAGGK